MDGTFGAADGSREDRRRVPLRVRRRLLVVLAVSTAAITLGPTPVGMLDGAHEAGRWVATRLPGGWGLHPTRGETEALLNVVVPLVLVLLVAAAWPTIRCLRLLVGAVVLSAFVETAQLAVPGRHPQPRDVVINTVGAGIGVAIVLASRRAWPGPAPSGQV